MKLDYVAYDRNGREMTATIDAANVAEATAALRRKGLYVSKITGGDSSPNAPAPAPADRPVKIKGGAKRMRLLASFMRQLHVLVSCDTPIVEGLGALERQAKDDGWKHMLGDVRRRVEEGASLSQAMEAYPVVFDAVTRSLIAAGESSGDMATMLNWLAETTRKLLRVRNTIRGSLLYPCLLLGVTVGVLALVLLFVIPRFDQLFKTLDVPLPPTTAILIGLSAWLRGYWWAILIAMGLGAVGLKIYLARPAGRRAWHTVVLRLPKLGQLTREFTTARIARLLGGLMEGHVPVLEALTLTSQSVRNCHYAELIDRAGDAGRHGEALSSAFRETDLISPSVCEAMHNGEQNGQIGPLLLNLADFLDDDNETVLRSLTSILEPVILLGMGLLVGTVALGMFMPLFDLTSMTQ